MSRSGSPTDAKEQVLSTMNRDGSRRWINPRLSTGAFWKKRRVVAWLLMALFVALPYIKVGGNPLFLLDIPSQHFILFGYTFLPTDTVLLMLFGVGLVLGVFLLTALYGRVWCGWACPQTVYMEFLFRPFERLFEGKSGRSGTSFRKVAKYVVFFILSMFLAHTFLAWFVGIDQLREWVTHSPLEQPTAFLVMAVVTGLIFFDFAYFREQTCVVACPYGRFQSVLLDRKSLIVGYDYGRGEPRGKVAKKAADGSALGDCVDCRACVATCPTGIDIREGLQMECIHCTQCMDACDAIMDRVGRPRGLIRYSSQDELEGKGTKKLRPRVVLYPVAALIVFGIFGWQLATKGSADVMILRGIGSPYTLLPSGEVSNSIRIKVTNRTEVPQSYAIELLGIDGARLVSPSNPLPVEPDHTEMANVFVVAPASELASGARDVTFRITDGKGFDRPFAYRLLGPRTNGTHDDGDHQGKGQEESK